MIPCTPTRGPIWTRNAFLADGEGVLERAGELTALTARAMSLSIAS
jgi:hypothetical protein